MTEQWMDDFRQVFYDFDDLEDHAKHIAQYKARFDSQDIEGYGNVLVNGRKAWNVEGENANKAVNIVVVDEDDDIMVDEVNQLYNIE
jgi:hypothetical protein